MLIIFIWYKDVHNNCFSKNEQENVISLVKNSFFLHVERPTDTKATETEKSKWLLKVSNNLGFS